MKAVALSNEAKPGRSSSRPRTKNPSLEEVSAGSRRTACSTHGGESTEGAGMSCRACTAPLGLSGYDQGCLLAL